MTLPALDGVLWLLLMLGPLLFLQISLHRELQGIFLLSTRSPQAAVLLFSLLFLPGVALHEASHFLMAKLMLVRTGGVSLLPRPLPGGKLQLGFVEVAQADVMRDALIGAAPLLSGGAVVAYIGIVRMGLLPLGGQLLAGNVGAFFQGLSLLPAQEDFWLWFYLAFVVSSTMLPSASDRRAWLPLALVFALLLGVALLTGAGPWMAANAAPGLNRALRAVAAVFAISLGVHAILLPPIWLLRKLISRLTGLELA